MYDIGSRRIWYGKTLSSSVSGSTLIANLAMIGTSVHLSMTSSSSERDMPLTSPADLPWNSEEPMPSAPMMGSRTSASFRSASTTSNLKQWTPGVEQPHFLQTPSSTLPLQPFRSFPM